VRVPPGQANGKPRSYIIREVGGEEMATTESRRMPGSGHHLGRKGHLPESNPLRTGHTSPEAVHGDKVEAEFGLDGHDKRWQGTNSRKATSSEKGYPGHSPARRCPNAAGINSATHTVQ